jgi:hypothetical protein
VSWTIERRGRVAVVRMTTNPVNAQNHAFFADLHDAFDRLERDHRDSPVVLTGTGRRFSAGLDLDEHFRLFAGDPAAVWVLVRRLPGDEHTPVHLPPSHRRRDQRPRLRRRPHHGGGLRPPHRRHRRRLFRAQRGADRHPAVRLFKNMNVSSVPADLTAAAAIRIAAMGLFAERGYAEVTVRQIASAAGVSPALVIHHYGSKENLRAVLEERVAVFVESMLGDLARVPEEGGSASVAGLFADRLEAEPGVAGYVRRLPADGGPAGIALFERLYQVTVAGRHAGPGAGRGYPAKS